MGSIAYSQIKGINALDCFTHYNPDTEQKRGCQKCWSLPICKTQTKRKKQP